MVVARREEAEQATENKRENQDEDVSVNLPRVKVGYGHVHHQEDVRHSSPLSNVKLEMRLAIEGQAMVAAAAAAATELGLSSFLEA